MGKILNWQYVAKVFILKHFDDVMRLSYLNSRDYLSRNGNLNESNKRIQTVQTMVVDILCQLFFAADIAPTGRQCDWGAPSQSEHFVAMPIVTYHLHIRGRNGGQRCCEDSFFVENWIGFFKSYFNSIPLALDFEVKLVL